jgi:hypothetical protein
MVVVSRSRESHISASVQSESEGDGGGGQEISTEAVLRDSHAMRSNSDASRGEQKHRPNTQKLPMMRTIFV